VPKNPTRSKPTKYIYGPVPSRRLGFSLGIDIIPHKNCTYDCIYCQLGKTLNKTLQRKEYTPTQGILDEVRTVLGVSAHIDYLTFSGSGEPTLHKSIRYLIAEIQKMTKIPIAVLTNGSLLYLPEVRNDLLNADVVLPTLCTVNKDTFQKIHRGHSGLDIDQIIKGYVEFRKIYRGKIWLEVMLLAEINDRPEQALELRKAIDKINPDKVHLNTVVRPPSEEYARPVSWETMQSIKAILGKGCEVIADFKHGAITGQHLDHLERIAATIARRPVTIEDLESTSGLHKNEILKYIQILLKEKRIEIYAHDKREYYRTIRGSDDRT
jgi:wyosine [tRNA(Phe)-imidazoG37] synthetase (radical SAM superfamily)